jgi:F-type H+-transporting ATPase subunit b
MKKVNKIMWLFYFFVAETMCVHLSGFDALASEGSGGWRPVYDEVLLWLNFGILAFVFIKFGRTPLMSFLRGRKEKIAREIERIEEKKKQAVDNISEIKKVLEESGERFADLKARIVEQGERKKQALLESAQQQSEMMIENARHRIDVQFAQARTILRQELIDSAIDVVMEKLPREITDEDNENFINQYLSSALSEQ